jgi:hypothetical protein
MNTPTTCVCREEIVSFAYAGDARVAPVYYVCAKHRHDPAALVNARRALRRRLERKALPAPAASE